MGCTLTMIFVLKENELGLDVTMVILRMCGSLWLFGHCFQLVHSQQWQNASVHYRAGKQFSLMFTQPLDQIRYQVQMMRGLGLFFSQV